MNPLPVWMCAHAHVVEGYIREARVAGNVLSSLTYVMEEAEYLCDRIAVIYQEESAPSERWMI